MYFFVVVSEFVFVNLRTGIYSCRLLFLSFSASDFNLVGLFSSALVSLARARALPTASVTPTSSRRSHSRPTTGNSCRSAQTAPCSSGTSISDERWRKACGKYLGLKAGISTCARQRGDSVARGEISMHRSMRFLRFVFSTYGCANDVSRFQRAHA